MYSTELYERLASETGLDPGWRGVGGLRLATTPERVEELRRQESAATTYGLELEHARAPSETRERLPLLAVDDVLAAAWLPGDGYLDPELLARRARRGRARRNGVALHHRRPRRPASRSTATGSSGVETDRGHDRDRDRGDRRRRRAGGRRPPRRRDDPDRARCATSTWSPSRSTPRCAPRPPPCATPTTSSTSAPRPAGCSSAATRATRSPGTSTSRSREPRTLFDARHGALRRVLGGRAQPRARAARRRDRQGRQRPRGVHPRRRVHPRRDGGGDAASGWRPASACTASPARAASAR